MSEIYNSAVAKKPQDNVCLIQPTERVAAFKAIRDLGYNLIPLNGKKPAIPKWKPYQTKSTGHSLEQWLENPFEASPLNFAILTGKKPYSVAPALVCVDAGTEEANQTVLSRCAKSPLITRTSRGFHHWYLRPSEEEIPYLQSTNGIADNVDVKADFGYAVCPGSSKANGFVYQWNQEWDVDLINSLPVYDPDWFGHELAAVPPSDAETPQVRSEKISDWKVQAARQFLDTKPPTEAGRNADGYFFVITREIIWGFDLDRETASDLLYEWGQKGVDDLGNPYPWTPREVNHKIDDVLKLSVNEEEIGSKEIKMKVRCEFTRQLRGKEGFKLRQNRVVPTA